MSVVNIRTNENVKGKKERRESEREKMLNAMGYDDDDGGGGGGGGSKRRIYITRRQSKGRKDYVALAQRYIHTYTPSTG
jgi:hypothetical protein